jgi:hypothetical protein
VALAALIENSSVEPFQERIDDSSRKMTRGDTIFVVYFSTTLFKDLHSKMEAKH